jgi:tetratricopeptide (TPR) repeat protein
MDKIFRVLVPAIAAVALAALPAGAQQGTPPAEPDAEPAATEDRATEERAERIAEANERVRESDYAAAAEILAALVDDQTEDASLLTLYGEVLVASGDAKRAVPVLQRAVRSDPRRPRLHFQLATAHTTLGEVDEALAAFAREIELNEDAEIRYLANLNRSILFERRKRWADAASALRSALALKPEQPDLYAHLVELYLAADELSEAIESLESGAAIGLRSASLYFNVGARLYNDHRYEDAEEAFRSALEIDSEMAQAERSLGATLSQLGRGDEAREHLGRYLELRPDAPDADEVRAHLAESGP